MGQNGKRKNAFIGLATERMGEHAATYGPDRIPHHGKSYKRGDPENPHKFPKVLHGQIYYRYPWGWSRMPVRTFYQKAQATADGLETPRKKDNLRGLIKT